MIEDIKNPIRVRHSIENDIHVIDIYTPDNGIYSLFRTSRVPITEYSSVEAIYSGYYEAFHWCSYCGADGIAVFSTDSEALERWDTDFNAR